MNDLNEIFSRTSMCEGLVIPKKLSFCMPCCDLARIIIKSILRSGVKEVYVDRANFAESKSTYGDSLPYSINPSAAMFNGAMSKANTEICIAAFTRCNVTSGKGFPTVKDYLSTTSDVYVIALSPFGYSTAPDFIILASRSPIASEVIEEAGNVFYDPERKQPAKNYQVSGGLGLAAALLMVAFSADIRCKLDENPEKVFKITNKEFFDEIEFRHID